MSVTLNHVLALLVAEQEKKAFGFGRGLARGAMKLLGRGGSRLPSRILSPLEKAKAMQRPVLQPPGMLGRMTNTMARAPRAIIGSMRQHPLPWLAGAGALGGAAAGATMLGSGEQPQPNYPPVDNIRRNILFDALGIKQGSPILRLEKSSGRLAKGLLGLSGALGLGSVGRGLWGAGMPEGMPGSYSNTPGGLPWHKQLATGEAGLPAAAKAWMTSPIKSVASMFGESGPGLTYGYPSGFKDISFGPNGQLTATPSGPVTVKLSPRLRYALQQYRESTEALRQAGIPLYGQQQQQQLQNPKAPIFRNPYLPDEFDRSPYSVN